MQIVLTLKTKHSGMLERQLVLETSYELDGIAGPTMLVVGFDINSIINHKVRHLRSLLLTKVTVPELGNTHMQS